MLIHLQIHTGTSIEIQRVMKKDFSFEKGRYALLNWYINHIQLQQGKHLQENDFDEEDLNSLANQHMYLRDPDEGNRTHAYLQLEGLIHLDQSQLTVSEYWFILTVLIFQWYQVGCSSILLKHLQKIEQEQNLNDQSAGSSIQPVILKAFSW